VVILKIAMAIPSIVSPVRNWQRFHHPGPLQTALHPFLQAYNTAQKKRKKGAKKAHKNAAHLPSLSDCDCVSSDSIPFEQAAILATWLEKGVFFRVLSYSKMLAKGVL
jgi:hypothetical protein